MLRVAQIIALAALLAASLMPSSVAAGPPIGKWCEQKLVLGLIDVSDSVRASDLRDEAKAYQQFADAMQRCPQPPALYVAAFASGVTKPIRLDHPGRAYEVAVSLPRLTGWTNPSAAIEQARTMLGPNVAVLVLMDGLIDPGPKDDGPPRDLAGYVTRLRRLGASAPVALMPTASWDSPRLSVYAPLWRLLDAEGLAYEAGHLPLETMQPDLPPPAPVASEPGREETQLQQAAAGTNRGEASAASKPIVGAPPTGDTDEEPAVVVPLLALCGVLTLLVGGMVVNATRPPRPAAPLSMLVDVKRDGQPLPERYIVSEGQSVELYPGSGAGPVIAHGPDGLHLIEGGNTKPVPDQGAIRAGSIALRVVEPGLPNTQPFPEAPRAPAPVASIDALLIERPIHTRN